MFWELTPRETEAILERHKEAERREYLRAGLIAATVVNVNRRKGAKLIRPEDFLRELPKPEDFMDPEEAVTFMDRWATQQQGDQQEMITQAPIDQVITG